MSPTKYVAKTPDESVNVSQDHPLKDLASMVVYIGLAVTAIYFVLGWLGSYLASSISYETEVKLGQYLMAEFSDKTSDDKPDDQPNDKPNDKRSENQDLHTIEKLVKELWQPFDNGRAIKFNVLLNSSKEPNAFMGPGGFIAVTNGFLSEATSENEISFVLCHELGHFIRRDALEGMGRGLVTALLLSVLQMDSNDLGIARTGIGFAELSYGRQRESRADEFAMRCLSHRYGHVKGFDSFFSRMAKKNRSLDDESSVGKYLSTHPVSSERISHLQQLARKNNWLTDGELVVWKSKASQ